MSTRSGTSGDDAVAELDAELLAVLDHLDEWAGRLEGLCNVFRATAGDRAEVRAEVYGDCAAGLRGVAGVARARRAARLDGSVGGVGGVA